MGRLEVRNLSKRLGGHVAVDDVSFDVEAEEFFVLLGPSGGGKSTLLRLICGLEIPDAGTVKLNGRDVTKAPPRDRNVGMVFQDYGLYPNMDVFDNIAYGLQARGLPREEIARRVPDAAEKVGLGDFLRRSIHDMSGGEQQRVALARALAKDAELYLYDEPLSNLDPKLRFRARHDILKVHRLKGQPSVYVTHDQGEAFAMGDRIAVLGGGGKLQQISTPDELMDHPANLFVARFIGSPTMNLLRCRLRRGAPHALVGDGFELPLPPRWDEALRSYMGDELVLGVRPEAMRVAGEGESSVLCGKVSEVEPLLGETALRLELGVGSGLYAILPDGDDSNMRVGMTARLKLDPEHLRLFDPTSEKALQLP